MSFRDRFFSRRVGRAITSPSGIMIAGAGAAVGLLLPFGGIPLAIGLGLAAWGAKVATAIPKSGASEVDYSKLRPPWWDYVREAIDAQRRFKQVVASTPEGPLRDRLASISGRFDDGVKEAGRIAQRGMALQDAVTRLDVKSMQRELAQAEAAAAQAPSESSQRTLEARRAQMGAAMRLDAVSRDASDRLRLLDARLDEAVARAVELSLSGDHGELSAFGSDVDTVVGEMEALRQALEETGGGATQIGVA